MQNRVKSGSYFYIIYIITWEEGIGPRLIRGVGVGDGSSGPWDAFAMYPDHVLPQDGISAKSCRTFLAPYATLAGVQPLMPLQVVEIEETSTALFALVRFLGVFRVIRRVTLQIIPLEKRFTANLTLDTIFSGV